MVWSITASHHDAVGQGPKLKNREDLKDENNLDEMGQKKSAENTVEVDNDVPKVNSKSEGNDCDGDGQGC